MVRSNTDYAVLITFQVLVKYIAAIILIHVIFSVHKPQLTAHVFRSLLIDGTFFACKDITETDTTLHMIGGNVYIKSCSNNMNYFFCH